MSECNTNRDDVDIDFIKIVTGGKITYSSNPLDEIKVVSVGIIFSNATVSDRLL